MAKFLRYEACPRCTENGRDRRGDNLAVYDDGGSHCFSCGRHRNPTRYVAPINLNKPDAPKSVLPADFTREVPAAAWQWLLQYGLSWKYWQPFVGWSEHDSRLVLTVGDPIEFSVGRYIPTDSVEGRTRTPRKWWAYGNAHRTPHVFGGDHPNGVVILVEDLISAHKVGQVTQCIPLFGTNVFNSVIPCLRFLRQPVIMWLDKDQQESAHKRAARLSMLTGLSVRYVFTESDPKSLSVASITEIVNEH